MSRKIKLPKRDIGLAFRASAPPRPCWLCRASPQVVDYYCRPCWEHQQRALQTIKRVNRGRKADRLSPAEERGKGL